MLESVNLYLLERYRVKIALACNFNQKNYRVTHLTMQEERIMSESEKITNEEVVKELVDISRASNNFIIKGKAERVENLKVQFKQTDSRIKKR